ncbi:hypothetical protein [Methylocystis parvus]|uniref:hypothetical protein n=1 Tax=Methylocystis parvus TaxID=134 RepID=UPI003C78DF6B
MNRFEVKERLAGVAGRMGGFAQTFATPLQKAHLSPLAGIVLTLLGTTTLFAALFAAYAFIGPLGSDADVKAPDWTPPTLAVVDLDPPKPPSADVEALSRPIFTKSRRPAPKVARQQATETGPLTAAPSGITVGAIVKNKKATQAFIVSPETPEGAWKKVGDTVDSWTIATIDRAELILKNGQQMAKLKLWPDDTVGPDSPAPPQPGLARPPVSD